MDILKQYSNRYRIRSKSIKNEDVELVCEIKIKAEESLILEKLNKYNQLNYEEKMIIDIENPYYNFKKMKAKFSLKIRTIHKYLGLIIGVQFLLWTISGLYFSWTDIDEIHGDNFRK
mgnify:CR=1 FL=1